MLTAGPALLSPPPLPLPLPPAPAHSLQVTVPKELQESLKWDMRDAGIPVPQASDRWAMAMHALKVGRPFFSGFLPALSTWPFLPQGQQLF